MKNTGTDKVFLEIRGLPCPHINDMDSKNVMCKLTSGECFDVDRCPVIQTLKLYIPWKRNMRDEEAEAEEIAEMAKRAKLNGDSVGFTNSRELTTQERIPIQLLKDDITVCDVVMKINNVYQIARENVPNPIFVGSYRGMRSDCIEMTTDNDSRYIIPICSIKSVEETGVIVDPEINYQQNIIRNSFRRGQYPVIGGDYLGMCNGISIISDLFYNIETYSGFKYIGVKIYDFILKNLVIDFKFGRMNVPLDHISKFERNFEDQHQEEYPESKFPVEFSGVISGNTTPNSNMRLGNGDFGYPEDDDEYYIEDDGCSHGTEIGYIHGLEICVGYSYELTCLSETINVIAIDLTMDKEADMFSVIVENGRCRGMYNGSDLVDGKSVDIPISYIDDITLVNTEEVDIVESVDMVESNDDLLNKELEGDKSNIENYENYEEDVRGARILGMFDDVVVVSNTEYLIIGYCHDILTVWITGYKKLGHQHCSITGIFEGDLKEETISFNKTLSFNSPVKLVRAKEKDLYVNDYDVKDKRTLRFGKFYVLTQPQSPSENFVGMYIGKDVDSDIFHFTNGKIRFHVSKFDELQNIDSEEGRHAIKAIHKFYIKI